MAPINRGEAELVPLGEDGEARLLKAGTIVFSGIQCFAHWAYPEYGQVRPGLFHRDSGKSTQSLYALQVFRFLNVA
jgi:hypothetical protein